jgi:chemotaxis response regulator CheB
VTRIRVLVVDDSVVVRRLVSNVLTEDPLIDVVGTAANGRLALAKLESLVVDVVTMDVEMPEMDGVSAVREMRRSGHTMPVIMFSTLTDRGASATLDALAAGASDYVTKPANVGSVGQSMDQVRSSLIPKIKALVPRRRPAAPVSAGTARRASTARGHHRGALRNVAGRREPRPAREPSGRLPGPRDRLLDGRSGRAQSAARRAAPAARAGRRRPAHARPVHGTVRRAARPAAREPGRRGGRRPAARARHRDDRPRATSTCT